MLAPALFLALLSPGQAPVELTRKFVKGEKSAYTVKSDLTVEHRAGSLNTFIPEDIGIRYAFTTEVLSLGPDGIAKVRYVRPSITQIEGETFDSPPKPTVEKLNQDVLLTLSPINEILDTKDQTPKKKGKARWTFARAQEDPIEDSMDEVYRLALFIGPLDSSLDLAPRLPLEEVKVGDTWKRTVGYQPQTIKGSDKKAVQRLDYVYTYQGFKTVNGKAVIRIAGALDLDTDLGAFVNQLIGKPASETGIKEIPLKLKGRITFDLDPKSLKTLRAVGTTEGEFKVFLTAQPDEPIAEERLRGTTTLSLSATPSK
jgi:hypothetical protein